MASTYTRLLYHIVFGTHGRKNALAKDHRSRIFEYLGGAIRDEGGTPIAINGVDDHVHILAGLRQDKALSSVVGQMKANSSRWIKRTFPGLERFAWQEG